MLTRAARRARSTAGKIEHQVDKNNNNNDDDDEIPFDELPSTPAAKQELQSPSLCRIRSHHLPQTKSVFRAFSMTRAATTTAQMGRHATSLLDHPTRKQSDLQVATEQRSTRPVTPNEPSSMHFVPRTTTYTTLSTNHNDTTIMRRSSTLVSQDDDNDVDENAKDDHSSFSDNSSSSSSSSDDVEENKSGSSSFGSAVSSLSGIWDFDNETDATFSKFGHSVGTSTLLQHYGDEDITNFTLLESSTAIGEHDDNDGIGNKQVAVIQENQEDDDSTENSMESETFKNEASEEIYTSFDVSKERSGGNNNGCGRMMMCCVADSEYGDNLDDFLEANNRQRRRKGRSNNKIKKQKVEAAAAQPASYLCQSLDCFGVFCFWKNESRTTDATVKTSDF